MGAHGLDGVAAEELQVGFQPAVIAHRVIPGGFPTGPENQQAIAMVHVRPETIEQFLRGLVRHDDQNGLLNMSPGGSLDLVDQVLVVGGNGVCTDQVVRYEKGAH
jgi:hypothetical protein